MKFIETYNKLEQLDQLIRLKATGASKDLAKKMNISRRSVYYLLDTMKNLGAEIEYNQRVKTYYYKKPFKIKLITQNSIKNPESIKGGKSINIYFRKVQEFCTT